MRLNPNLILRQVGGEYMIVNPFSEDEAGALLCNEYEVNKDTARNDANELCRQWLETGLAIE